MGIPSLRTSTPAPSADRPNEPLLLDRFGRIARDLRISITEKCSLRCTYCMPAEGLPAIAPDRLLSAEEIARVVGIAAHRLGIRDVRFTGGEPLVRKDLVDIVARCSAAAPGLSLAMTTNAIGLDRRARDLVAAGLTRVNVSLDTVDRRHFETLTRRDRLPAVMAGIDAALAAGLSPLKINAVLMPETLDGATDLLAWCLDRGVHLRFIEQMPLDADHGWTRAEMVTAAQIRHRLSTRFRLTPHPGARDGAPAELWDVHPTTPAGAPEEVPGAGEAPLGTVGVIASVTEPFCADCKRTRITAEGRVRSCLFSHEEVELLPLLRAGATDAELAERWRAAMWAKPAAHGMDHTGLDSPDYVQPERPMSAIGG